MQRQHFSIKDIFEACKVRDRLQSRRSHHFMGLPLRYDSSRVQHDHLIAQGKYFFSVMSDEENRDAVILVPLPQIAHQQRLRRTIERRQRLIEQQRSRFGHQRASQRDSLALASGDLPRPPIAQVTDPEQVENFAAAHLPLRAAQRAETVRDILLGGKVGEKSEILMDVTNAAFPGGYVLLLLRVVKVFAAYRDAAFVRIGQSGNGIEQRGFPCARCAEENRETGERAKVDIQIEAALGIREALADADFEIGGNCRWRAWCCGW